MGGSGSGQPWNECAHTRVIMINCSVNDLALSSHGILFTSCIPIEGGTRSTKRTQQQATGHGQTDNGESHLLTEGRDRGTMLRHKLKANSREAADKTPAKTT